MVINSNKTALEQFMDGLIFFNILVVLQNNSNLFEDFMCLDHIKLTYQTFEQITNIVISVVGSTKRSIENRCLSFWRDYLLGCDGKYSMKFINKKIS